MKRKIGLLTAEFLGEGEVFNSVINEFFAFPKDNATPDIIYNFSDGSNSFQRYKCKEVCFIEDCICADNLFSVQNNYLDFCLYGNLNNQKEQIQIDISANTKDKFPIFMRRCKDWNYLSRSETLAKDFLYNIFDFSAGIKMLQSGASFIHASSIQKKGNVVLFIATGGIGKTSLLLQFLKQQEWKYLSDDLSLIDSEGGVYLNPKYLQIYAYNLLGDKKLTTQFMRGRSVFDKINWYYRRNRFGNNLVRRRISPIELFGKEKVGDKGKVVIAIQLIRTNGEKFKLNRVNKQELINCATETLLLELSPFSRYSYLNNGSCSNANLPTTQVVKTEINKVLTTAFKNVVCYQIAIPQYALPEALYRFVQQTEIINDL